MTNVIPLRRRRPARPSTAPQTYTPAEVAELLGLSLSSVYHHLRAGIIPGRKIGSRWLIPRRVLHAWLDHGGQDGDVDAGPWPEEGY